MTMFHQAIDQMVNQSPSDLSRHLASHLSAPVNNPESAQVPRYLRTEQGNQELQQRLIKLSARQRALLRMIEADLSNGLNRLQLNQLASPENLSVLLQYGLIMLPQQQPVAATRPALGHPVAGGHNPMPAAPAGAGGIQQLGSPRSMAPTGSPLGQPRPPEPTPIAAVPERVAASPAAEHLTLGSMPPAQPAVDEPVAAAIDATPPRDAQRPVAAPVVAAPLASEPAAKPEEAALESEPLSFEQVKQLMSTTLKQYCGLMAHQLIRDIQQAPSPARLKMCQIHWITSLTESRADSEHIAAWHRQVSQSLLG